MATYLCFTLACFIVGHSSQLTVHSYKTSRRFTKYHISIHTKLLTSSNLTSHHTTTWLSQPLLLTTSISWTFKRKPTNKTTSTRYFKLNHWQNDTMKSQLASHLLINWIHYFIRVYRTTTAVFSYHCPTTSN